MSTDHNREIVSKYIGEVLSDFDYTHFDEYVHDDFAAYPGGNLLDKANHQKYFGKMRATTPNMRNNLKEMIAEGDKVVAISVWTGNIPPDQLEKMPADALSGMKTIAIYTIKDGKIVAGEVHSNR